MKGKVFSRLMSVFLTVLLAASVLSVCAAADGVPCKECAEAGLEFTGFTATTDFKKISETECARVYVCNNGHRQLIHNNSDGSFKDTTPHVATTNATCEKAAVCGNCGQTFGAPLDHVIVIDKAVKATCTKTGLTEGSHCSRCGKILVAQTVVPTVNHSFDAGKVTSPTCSNEGYTTYTCKDCGYQFVTDKVSKLSHWYAEWKPAGSGQNSAPCKRSGCTYIKTTACVDWDFKLIPAGAEKAEDYSVCPVCGAMSDGGRLELVKDATVRPITGWTPEGDMVLRCGTMENGETVMCVGFEFDARLVQCTGRTNFTVPAEVLEGYQLMLLDADGNETEVEVETVGQKATFMLDFSNYSNGGWIPVKMLHLVPLEPEVTVEATEEAAGK